ncbi:MAG: hypothetical protein MUO40_02555 [Anaerolineaceae bacterium]|nr:hypothetical protein [Anaerolineaceae bacterium]
MKNEVALTGSFGIILSRVGLVLMMCGILVGLIFSKWTPILIVGITFILPEITRRLIENRGDELRQDKIST